MVLQWIEDLLGSVPADYEVLLYIGGLLILIFSLCEAFRFLHYIFKAVSQL